jgi:hypothetical protein
MVSGPQKNPLVQLEEKVVERLLIFEKMGVLID